jgi:hypothetical protein
LLSKLLCLVVEEETTRFISAFLVVTVKVWRGSLFGCCGFSYRIFSWKESFWVEFLILVIFWDLLIAVVGCFPLLFFGHCSGIVAFLCGPCFHLGMVKF